MGKKLEGRVALVTGSGRNIGRAIALRFAEEGAAVVLNARSNEEELQSAVADVRAIGGRALGLIGDVGRHEDANRLVSSAQDEFGRVDILVNNAAIRPSKPFLEISLEDWDQARSVVLDGAFYMTKAVAPGMVSNGYGRVLFMIGEGAFTGSSPRAHVSAAKMGLVGLMRSLAKELGPSGIRLNAISPGIIDTTRIGGIEPPGADRVTDGPLGRKGASLEIAEAAVYLVSEDSSFVTGQTLHVNGGAGLLA